MHRSSLNALAALKSTFQDLRWSTFNELQNTLQYIYKKKNISCVSLLIRASHKHIKPNVHFTEHTFDRLDTTPVWNMMR